MPGFLKAFRETAAASLRGKDPSVLRLQEVDPTLIDCCIYEWNAAQLRYQFLLRKFKSWES